MKKMGLFLSFVVVFGVLLGTSGCVFKKDDMDSNKNAEPVATKNNQKLLANVEKKPIYDLYSETPYEIPLYSIVEIAKLTPKVKKAVDEILEASQGFYFLRVNNDNVFVILQNPAKTMNVYPRNELQFAEIDMEGNVTYHNAGYTGVDGEIENAVGVKEDVWTFDETIEPFRPLKHVVYDEKGKIKFTEIWNYEENNSVKYQMKNASKKVLSILKESQDNDSNYRKEHIFYDNDGNIVMSLTVNYDGANISRLNYYNSHDLIDSVSIFSEYENGLRVKESIYDENYELMNTVVSTYINEKREAIEMFDKDGNKIQEIKS